MRTDLLVIPQGDRYAIVVGQPLKILAFIDPMVLDSLVRDANTSNATPWLEVLAVKP